MSLELETLVRRGFGGLTPAGWGASPAGTELPLAGPAEPFSYFTYPIIPAARPDIPVDPYKLFDETWARIPLDSLWAFVNQHTVVGAGPCLLCLHERLDGRPALPCPELAEHWCPARYYAE